MNEGVLWGLAVVMAFALGYSMQLAVFTREFGVGLADAQSGTGYQDAITPPWVTKFMVASYIGLAAVAGAIWWQSGWASALGSLVLILLGSVIAKRLLPRLNGDHYQRLILQSMIHRYADFLKNGDAARAEAMKYLLIKAGIDPDALASRS